MSNSGWSIGEGRICPADYFAVIRRLEWAAILGARYPETSAPVGSGRQRHKVHRTGERTEVPEHVRVAVYIRDRNICRSCNHGVAEGERELDHIRPWSNGGSHRSDNLRLLCRACNQGRSNFRDGAQPERRCTWWCIRCWNADDPQRAGWTNKFGEWGWRERTEFIYEPSEADLVPAFCAFCRVDGYTTDDDRLI